MQKTSEKKLRAERILTLLEQAYPDASCELNYTSEYELLVAVILSAQCTDKRVNAVTPSVFALVPTVWDMARMDQSELEKLIFSCGFYRNKAKNIISASKAICEKHAGVVPSEFDDLLALPGVGRKTANVMMAEAFKKQAIAVDTHVFRTSNRLNLAKGKTPHAVEDGLRKILPEDKYSRAHHLLIFHGRYTCKSRSPKCEDCKLYAECNYKNKTLKEEDL